jgi:hypothetical protein
VKFTHVFCNQVGSGKVFFDTVNDPRFDCGQGYRAPVIAETGLASA